MKRLIFLLTIISFFYSFAGENYDIKVLTQNNTGFPKGAVNFVLYEDNIYIAGTYYDKYHPGGITIFDGRRWKLIKKGDKGFPLAEADNLLIPKNSNRIFAYGKTSTTYPDYYQLCYYDSYQDSWFRIGDSTSLSGFYAISDMAMLSNGDLYACGGNGFYKVETDTLFPIKPKDAYIFYANYILPLANDEMFLVGNYADGWGNPYVAIHKYDPVNGFTILYARPDSITGTFTAAIDGDENIWMVDTEKIVSFSLNGSEKIYRSPFTSIPHYFYYATAYNNEIWILAREMDSSSRYIYRFDIENKEWEKYNYNEPYYEYSEPSLIRISDNYFYTLKNSVNLIKFDKQSGRVLEYYSQDNTGIPFSGIPYDITKILIGPEKHYWFNSLNFGIAELNDDIWNVWSSWDINGQNVVTSWDFCFDSQGRLFSVGDSLRWMENGVWHAIKPLDYFYGKSIAADDNGNIWIADNYNGLCKFYNDEITYYNTYNSGIISDYLTKVFVDRDNNIWIGFQYGGISMFDGTEFHNFGLNEGIPSDWVTGITQGPDGALWFSFLENGIARYKDGSWTFYNSSNSGLPNNAVRAIEIDKSGNLWAGHNENDTLYVTKFDGTQWEKIYLDNDYRVNVLDIAVDNNNNVFISTEASGVWILNENEVVLAVKEQKDAIPHSITLEQNYPNPFNPVTNIRFSLDRNYTSVELSIYDLLGRKIATLVNGSKPAGNYVISWDASKVASGLYFYVLKAGNKTLTRKMILLK